MSSEKTAGQMAYEAFKAWRAERDPMMICTDWTHPAVAHEGWEAAAAAVETEQVRLARQDRDQLRKAVLDLAAKLEDEAARTYSAALRLLGDPAGLVLEEQAEAKRSAAIRLRKTAGPPA